MASFILASLYNGALLAICAFALLRGGLPEKIGAICNIVATYVTNAARMVFPSAWAPASSIVTIIDLCVLLSFFWLATRSTRFWPIWAFGFGLADIVTSVAGVLLPKAPLFAYHTGLGIYAYLALGVLAIGTYRLPRDATADQRRGLRSQWGVPETT